MDQILSEELIIEYHEKLIKEGVVVSDELPPEQAVDIPESDDDNNDYVDSDTVGPENWSEMVLHGICSDLHIK